jgi:hypothetical protein
VVAVVTILAGVVLVWSVMLAASVVVLAVPLPLLLVCRALARRGEDDTTPDDLDDVLRARIDGDGGADATNVLGCGCRRTGQRPVARCMDCGWVACVVHALGTHLCERVDPVDAWLNSTPRLKPLNLDDSAAEPNELLTEIYEYLEQRS